MIWKHIITIYSLLVSHQHLNLALLFVCCALHVTVFCMVVVTNIILN